MTSRLAALALAACSAAPAFGQSVLLGEAPKPGDCAKYAVELQLAGNLLVTQDGEKRPMKLEAKARHVFAARTLGVGSGMPTKSARHYDDAVSSAVVAGDRTDHALPADRRLVVARADSEGLFCFAAAGPLTRDELDLVTEHFDPQCLPGLLPNREVKPGDKWDVANNAAQAACLFDGLIENKLVGRLVEVKDGAAVFAVEGTAAGIEHGAKVSLTITATGKFDLASKRVTELTWKQKDERDQGPVNPASQLEATVTVRGESLAAPPQPLADAALAGLPKGEVPPILTYLRYADPKGRYQFVYPREWHITGQTDPHLVLRLLDRGEFIAQATITAWKKADPGKHTPADEFKKAVSEAPGWVVGRVFEDGELPTDGGRWLYRVAAEGRIQDKAVVQSFHLLAGPQGDQVVVTIALTPDKLKAVGTRDVGLVNGIEFGKK